MKLVETIMQKAGALGVRVLLPEDVVVAEKLESGATYRVVRVDQIPADQRIADIGPLTVTEYTKELEKCRTVAWNGPMGVFEIPQFSEGTKAVATVLAGLDATTVIGGGSTAEAVTQLGLAGKMTHVSTGGGAFLQFLSGKTLPGSSGSGRQVTKFAVFHSFRYRASVNNRGDPTPGRPSFDHVCAGLPDYPVSIAIDGSASLMTCMTSAIMVSMRSLVSASRLNTYERFGIRRSQIKPPGGVFHGQPVKIVGLCIRKSDPEGRHDRVPVAHPYVDLTG